MNIDVSPDNCFLVDKTKTRQEVAFRYHDWLIGRTPLNYKDFGEVYRVALIHPELDRWFRVGEFSEPSLSAYQVYHGLQNLIPMVRDRTLSHDVIQVLEHITIRSIA